MQWIESFTLYGAGKPESFATKVDAIARARALNLEAFEVLRDVDGLQVYVEWPQPVSV